LFYASGYANQHKPQPNQQTVYDCLRKHILKLICKDFHVLPPVPVFFQPPEIVLETIQVDQYNLMRRIHNAIRKLRVIAHVRNPLRHCCPAHAIHLGHDVFVSVFDGSALWILFDFT
jgi:hypothetical protein